MSVKFKAVLRGEPGVTGGGKKKYYASIIHSGEASIRNLSQRIAAISTVSQADTIAVLESLIMVLPDMLDDGKIIRLGDFASLRLSIGSNGEVNEQDLSSANIVRRRIIFTPGDELKFALSRIKFEKNSS